VNRSEEVGRPAEILQRQLEEEGVGRCPGAGLLGIAVSYAALLMMA